MRLKCLPNEDAYSEFLKSTLLLGGIGKRDWHLIQRSLEGIKPDLLCRFYANRSKYFSNHQKGDAYLRSWHYSQLVLVLHALARHQYISGSIDLAERIYFAMVSHTSYDLYYEVDLPILASCDHPLGAVIGRGKFSKNSSLQFSSGCNIGNNNGVYPEIQGNLLMLPGSALVGNSIIRGNVVMAKGAYLKDAGLIEDKIVFGTSPRNVFKTLSLELFSSLSMFRPAAS
jgi:hypothetical protein